jgi:hypothetical protein
LVEFRIVHSTSKGSNIQTILTSGFAGHELSTVELGENDPHFTLALTALSLLYQ